MARTHVTCTINGDEVEFLCDQDETLLNALRDEVGLTGVWGPHTVRAAFTHMDATFQSTARLVNESNSSANTAVGQVADQAGYGIVREYTGHGIGRQMHEEPQVPHVGKAGTGLRLREGMVITVEPMISPKKSPAMRTGSVSSRCSSPRERVSTAAISPAARGTMNSQRISASRRRNPARSRRRRWAAAEAARRTVSMSSS